MEAAYTDGMPSVLAMVRRCIIHVSWLAVQYGHRAMIVKSIEK
jgi:hypothetical protein